MAFAWAANPFTAYTLNMNANDALVGAAVAWTLAALSIPAVRGVLLAVAGYQAGSAGHGAGVPGLRNRWATRLGFVAASALLLVMLAFERHGLRALLGSHAGLPGRPHHAHSIWTLPNYHPGWPHLEGIQKMAQILVGIGIGLMAFLPRRGPDGTLRRWRRCAARP